jgi:F0F1-type ATP synthase membrane subunit b/b'
MVPCPVTAGWQTARQARGQRRNVGPAGHVITPEVGDGLDERARAAREAVAAADRATREAAAQSRTVARELHQAGLSGRDIAAVLKVSAQRVSQLLKSA